MCDRPMWKTAQSHVRCARGRGCQRTPAPPPPPPRTRGPRTRGTVKTHIPFCGTLWCSAVPVGSGLAGRTSERAPAPEVPVSFQRKTPRHGRCDRTQSSHRPEAFSVTLQSRRFFKSMNFNCVSLNYKQHMIFFFVWKISEQHIGVLQHFIRVLALN